MACFYHLPKELVEEIMSWLPPKSLVQAKCVSRSWNTLISDFLNKPGFVTRHLCNMKSKPSTSLVFRPPRGRFSLLTLFNDDGCGGHIRSVIEDIYIPLLQGEACIGTCHCDGIVCVVKDYGTIMLCNPTFQEFKLLPEPKIKATRSFLLGMGFGYDARAEDYKLVLIWKSDYVVRAEVYTLGTDSWKEIKVPQNIHMPIFNCEALYWSGVCYWMMCDTHDGDKDIILCFDMCNEEFHIMPGPCEIELDVWSKLFVWNDSVALFLCSVGSDPLSSTESDSDREDLHRVSIEICVMDKSFGESVKGASSWSRSVHITPPTDIEEALTFWKGDEFLMKDGHGQLVSYNLSTKMFRNIATNGSSRIGNWACSYVQSLVSVRGEMKPASKISSKR